ncbi:ATP-dependent protease [Sulfurimicrobium lacus]|uniref:ATP-dependent protease n=1 Tax=Sulfurimicrobium lacus TaxID=2715678 RepID=A0A6F8VI70_9PROT|nr:LON peptidase substrate-binding domain-containing protein [Sulfurimicrobium lacus]BCB28465.1 ATP-dependent protease [Sulfurimicrobium lacus]
MPLDLKQRLSDFLLQARQHTEYAIPLFPLNTVLFPGGKLTLKVFEPRYMEMVSACLKDKTNFGICLIRTGQETGDPAVPEQVGCMVEITDWDMQQLGMLDIAVLGTHRFHIEDSRTEKNGLILAQVISVAEEQPFALPKQHEACATVLRRIIEHLGVERFAAPLRYDDSVWVGYRLAELLPLKLSVRQNMLEMNDSLIRIEILHHFLSQQGLLE